MIDISKTNSKEKKETEKNLIKGDQDLEEFFEIFQKNLEEAERRKRKEEELNMSLELHKKDNSNGYIIYQPVPGVITNNYANSIFNIVKESGTAKLFLNIDPFELYYNLEKIFDKIDEKMFDFDMMVAECLFKLKYRFKIKELSFKSLK